MIGKKRKITILISLMLIICVVILTCMIIFSSNRLTNFADLIERGDYRNLRLTIYYDDPGVFAWPTGVEHLMENYKYRIVVDGNQLSEYTKLLHRLANVELVPNDETTTIYARIFIVFENRRRRMQYEVVISYDTAVVNGVKFQTDDIFLELLIPFVPDEEAALLKWLVGIGEFPFD